MEIKNNTVYSEDIIKKYIKFSMHKGKHHSARKILCNTFFGIMIGLVVILCVITLLIDPSSIIDSLLALVVVMAIVLILFVFLPRLSYKNSKKIIGSNMQYVFNENNFTINSSSELASSNGTFKYDFLYKVYETNNYYYLYINKIAASIVSKDGLENTTPDEFSKFLESKLPPKKFIRCQ